MIVKKGEPERIEQVGRPEYYRRIREGWKGVTAAKVARRVRALISSFDMTHDEFWEFLNTRFDALPISHNQFRCVMRGEARHDSRVDAMFLMVMSTATAQPLRWFTRDNDRAPNKPWRKWDFEATRQGIRKLSFYQVTYHTGVAQLTKLVTAYDRAHAQSLTLSNHPDVHILNVVEIPAAPGIEIG